MARKMNRKTDRKHFRRDAMRGKSFASTSLVRGGPRI